MIINLANKGGKMTSKDISIFNSLKPFSVGFDDMFDQFESHARERWTFDAK